MLELSEKDYSELFKYSLHSAYKYVGYREVAFDIAQNALLSFLTSQKDIANPRAWIKVVLRREASKYFAEQQKTQAIVIKKANERTHEAEEDARETDKILSLSNQKVKKILSKADYNIFVLLKKAKFCVQSYSVREEIAYNTARNHKTRIKRNILSQLLMEDGWRNSKKILNYAQYYNIQRFLTVLIESVKTGKLEGMIHYTSRIDPKLISDTFADIDECIEWTVSCKDNEYSVFLVNLRKDSTPSFCTLTIKFTRANTINIINVVGLSAVRQGVGDITLLSKYENKGKYEFTSKQFENELKHQVIQS